MKKIPVSNFCILQDFHTEALKDNFHTLQEKYPASFIVNFLYLKWLQENWRSEYEKQKSKWLLTIPDRKLFMQIQLEFSEIIPNLIVEIKLSDEIQKEQPKIEEVASNSERSVVEEENPLTVEVEEKKIDEEEIDGLVEKFSHNVPKIIFDAEVHDPNANFGEASCKEDPDIISETLAIIYASQGYTGRAEKIFKKLSLQFPEKSCYFADQIKKIKNKEFNQ